VKHANATPRVLGSKDNKDNNEQGNETPKDSLKPQSKTLTTISNAQTTKRPRHNELPITKKPKIPKMRIVNKEKVEVK
jgi:hypothetical protein